MLPHNTYVVIGPESTGKTTLCEALAKHYHGFWIPEYARSYVEKLNRPYTYDDVIHIAQKQIDLEETINFKKDDYLFIDTDLIITKVWLLHVFKKYPQWLDDYLKKAYRKSYFLCSPDLPWEFDPVRENPNLRDYFFNWYEREIVNYGYKYFIINGKNEQRIINAINCIQF